MADTIRVRPFSNGSQFYDWTDANCCHCKLGGDDGMGTDCPIRTALDEAYFDDGTVGHDIAQRMNATRYVGQYNWPCGEIQPVDQEVVDSVAAFHAEHQEATDG